MGTPDDLLSVRHGSLTFENPFVLASGPPTASGEMIRRAFDAGWGAAVTKTITPDDMVIEDLSPRFAALKNRKNSLIGFENIELLSKRNTSYWIEEIRSLKRHYPSKILIASIMADPMISSWQRIALTFEKAGADALELNFSCPHGMPEKHIGAAIGQNADLVREITKGVKEQTGIPVIVKLTPNVTEIGHIAKAAAEGKADAISAINTVQCLLGVNIENFNPLPDVASFSTYGGYSGPAVKPIGLRVVSQIASAVDLPIHGIGGISNFEDAIEYILVGATVVQVCTAVMWDGFSIVQPMLRGLRSYMERKNIGSVGSMRGRTLAKLTAHKKLDRKTKSRPRPAREDLCIGCGRCVSSCSDGGYGAVRLEGKRAVFDHELCDGCSLCSLVCPQGAIEMTMLSGE